MKILEENSKGEPIENAKEAKNDTKKTKSPTERPKEDDAMSLPSSPSPSKPMLTDIILNGESQRYNPSKLAIKSGPELDAPTQINMTCGGSDNLSDSANSEMSDSAQPARNKEDTDLTQQMLNLATQSDEKRPRSRNDLTRPSHKISFEASTLLQVESST